MPAFSFARLLCGGPAASFPYVAPLASSLLFASFLSAQTPSFEALPLPPGATRSSLAYVSRDGAAIIAHCYFENPGAPEPRLAVRWDASSQPEVLESLSYRSDGWAQSTVSDLSHDGSVAVGQSYHWDASDNVLGDRPVRWNAVGDIEELEVPWASPTGVRNGSVNAVSADGSIAVGYASKYEGGEHRGSFASRWNASGDLEELESLNADSLGRKYSYAHAVSADGSVAVGFAYAYDDDGTSYSVVPVRWNSAGEIELLEIIGSDANGRTSGLAQAVSYDGSFAVGSVSRYDGDGNFVGRAAVRWNATGEVEIVGPYVPGPYGRERESGYYCSSDGSVVAGHTDPYIFSSYDEWSRAFWTSNDEGPFVLPTLAPDGQGGYFGQSWPRELSADGRTFVGYCDSSGAFYREAWIWRRRQLQSLEAMAADYGLDLEADGWAYLNEATDCSGDGSVIVGHGRKDGLNRAFRAVLPFNDPPSLAGDVAEGESVDATVGFEYEATFTADDPEGHELTLSAEGLSPGASISPAPGTTLAPPFDVTLTWTPEAADINTTHAIVLSVQDQIGSSASLSFELTVPQNERPTIATIEAVSAECDGNGAEVELSTTVDDADGHPLTVMWSVDGVVVQTDSDVPAGSATNFVRRFGDGAHVVTVDATDGIDLASTSMRVSVTDTTAPVLVVAADVVVPTDRGRDYASGVELEGPTVADLCDGDPLVFSDAPAVFPLGETIVEWTAIDADGNVGVGTQSVVVEDQEAPEILVDDVTEPVDRGKIYATIRLPKPYAIDNATEEVDLTNDAPEVFPIGLTVVTWTATDEAGNSATAEQRVRVTNQRPVADAGAAVAVVAKSKEGVRVRLDGRGSSDADRHKLKYLWSAKDVTFQDASSPTPVGFFPPGVTRVGLMVTDEGGKTDKSFVRVQVQVEKPDRPKRRSIAASRPRAGQIAAYVNESRLLCEQLSQLDPNNGYFAYAAYYAKLADRYDAAARRVKSDDPPRPSDYRRYFANRELQVQCSFYAAQSVYAGYWHSPGVNSFYETFVAAYVASGNAGYAGKADLK